MNKLNYEVLVISVGDTEYEIIKSIEYYNPKVIIFYASHSSVDTIYKAKNATETNNYIQKIIVVDDPNDLLDCFEKAKHIKKYIENMDYQSENVIVNYTCGTKNMSVALVLSTIENGYEYCYIGDENRDNFIVKSSDSNKDKIYHVPNLWDKIAIKEKTLLNNLFNLYQFKSAAEYLESYLTKIKPKLKMQVENWKNIALLLDNWCNFRYGPALSLVRNINIEYLKKNNDKQSDFLNFIQDKLIPHCQKIHKEIKSKKYSIDIINDMISNAEKQAEIGDYDDAVIRMYRSIEMLSQLGLQDLGLKDDEVKPDDIPETVRNEFCNLYMPVKVNPTMKLGLQGKFELLYHRKHKYGLLFHENRKYFTTLQFFRNKSILVHGTEDLTKEKYEKVYEIVLQLFPEYEAIKPPKLYFDYITN